jgi:hypothetical protein
MMQRNRAMPNRFITAPDTDDSDGANRRRASRNRVRVTADFRKVGRTPFRVQVVDLSQTGCHCETTSKVMIGDRVWITLNGLEAIEAIIRWATPFGFGCEWAHPMHISVFEHICRQHPQFG